MKDFEDMNLKEIRSMHPDHSPFRDKNGKLREICKKCKLKWDV